MGRTLPSNLPPPKKIPFSNTQRVWEILNLWYKDAYESAQTTNRVLRNGNEYLQELLEEQNQVTRRLQRELRFWQERYHSMAVSRDRIRMANRTQSQRITSLEEEIQQLRRHNEFLTSLNNDWETESEDLTEPTSRTLNFDSE